MLRRDDETKQRFITTARAPKLIFSYGRRTADADMTVSMGVKANEQIGSVDFIETRFSWLLWPGAEHFHAANVIAEALERIDRNTAMLD